MALAEQSGGRGSPRPLPWIIATMVGAAAIVAGVAAWSGGAAASSPVPDAEIPSSPDVVVEQLPGGYAVVAMTDGHSAGAVRIRGLLALAARTGDGRFASRAEAMFDDLPAQERDTVRTRRLRAHSLQHSHEFEDAARLLDAVIEEDPGDSDSRLARAQIRLVLGRIGQARDDCRAIALGMDVVRGIVCTAAVELRLGRYGQAAHLLDNVLADTDRASGLMAFARLMRAEASSRAGESRVADMWFARALAQSPDDVRVSIAAARHLRRTGRPVEALALLDRANDSDGIRVQRALAALEAGRFGANARARALIDDFARAKAQGAVPEARDEAELMLAAGGDPVEALAVALENFETQRDYEDVAILQSAARRAGQPGALAALHAWAATEGVYVGGTTR